MKRGVDIYLVLCRPGRAIDFCILVTTKNALILTDAQSRSLLIFYFFFVSKATENPLPISFVKLSLNTAGGWYCCYRVSSRPATGASCENRRSRSRLEWNEGRWGWRDRSSRESNKEKEEEATNRKFWAKRRDFIWTLSPGLWIDADVLVCSIYVGGQRDVQQTRGLVSTRYIIQLCGWRN